MPSTLRLLVILAMALAACAPRPANVLSPSTPAQPTAPADVRDEQQVLRLGAAGLMSNPTPLGGGASAYQLWPQYDSLTMLGKDYAVRPSVAEKWDLLPSGTTWEFAIRRDMKWPNGDPLTAADVAWTFNSMIEKNWPQKSFFGTSTEAKATGQYTVQITTRQQDQTVPYAAQNLWIWPMKYAEQVGVDGFIAKPMGSGPYELVEYRAGDVAHFKKRSTPHAFRKAIADEIFIRQIPDNAQAIAGLRTGDLDITPLRNYTAEQANQLKAAGFNVLALPGSNIAGIMPQGSNELRKTPLTDKRVRQAINYAVDREGMAKSFYGGYGDATGQLASVGTLYYDPGVKPFPFDPQKAKQLLAEAGYPNGFKLEEGLDFTPSMVSQDLPVAVQSNLKDVGIETAVNSLEIGAYVDKAFGRKLMADMMFGSTSDMIGFGPSRSFQGCGKPLGGMNGSTWYCNPEWDKLMDQAYAERDLQKRIQLMRQANTIQRDDTYLLFMMNVPTYVVTSPKIRGADIPLPFIYNFDSAYRVK